MHPSYLWSYECKTRHNKNCQSNLYPSEYLHDV
jgi:hypothetical protein